MPRELDFSDPDRRFAAAVSQLAGDFWSDFDELVERAGDATALAHHRVVARQFHEAPLALVAR